MAGYIGSKSSVTQVDGYSEAEADAEFVNDPNGAITVSGSNVGIGTSSPSEKLTIQSGNLSFMGGTNDAQYIKFGDTGDDDIGSIFYYHGNNNMVFTSNASEAMRIDSSGNLLVGKTTTALATAGITLGESGFGSFTRSGYEALNVNRLSSFGAIAKFYKDGTEVGSIGTPFTGELSIAASGTNSSGLLLTESNAVRPMKNGSASDATQDLGRSNGRWKDAYLSGGVYLGGTGSANKLDDYEEGTWTPTALQGASGLSHETANCCYTKIGRMVTLQFEIYNLTSPNGNPFNLGGIPFSSDQEGTGSVMYNNVDIPGSRTQIVVYASSSNFLRFYGLGDNTTWEALVGNNMGTSFNMIGQVTYMTA